MILGLSGYSRAGKDTAASALAELGFKRIAFADALKAVLADVDPLALPDRRLGFYRPKVEAPVDWEKAKRNPEVRELLQRLGVACRDHLGPNVWVDAVMRKIDYQSGLLRQLGAPYDREGGARWTISDVRFPNEAAAIKQRGGKIWRITRPGCNPVNGHVSETALDHWDFDADLLNNGTVDDLRRSVAAELQLVR